MDSSPSNMKNKKKLSSPPKTEQFSYDNHKNIQKPVVPIGPRFQAVLPTFIGHSYKKLDTSRWLGTKVWPVKITNLPNFISANGINKAPREKLNPIGKGRADNCSCQIPGSSECVKMHIAKEKIKLQNELGAAFWEWKFGEMGEGASLNWTANEKQKFDYILEMNFSKNSDFLKTTIKALPNKKMEAVISYYFNIIVPRKMSMKIKSGRNPLEITTDDEDKEENFSRRSCPKKRSKIESQSLKRRYLTGVR